MNKNGKLPVSLGGGTSNPWRLFGRSILVLIVLFNAFFPLSWQTAGFSSSNLPSSRASTSGVVLSQVDGGGGGSSGTYLNDYVELFNSSSSAVDVSGWSLQYGSATGNFAASSSNLFAFPASTVIQPGHYLLVQLGAAGTAGNPLPVTPDLTTTNLSMSGASGKVALVNNSTALGCGATATPCTLPGASIVDVVAYGASNNAEGGTSVNNGVAITSQQGAVRKNNGCQDTDNNSNDFDVVTGPTPRNSSSQANNCSNSTPALSANPSSVSFTSQVGGSIQSKVVSITATSGQITYSVSSVVNSPAAGTWLSVQPNGGTTPGAITVQADPTGLTAGTYTGTVTITDVNGVATALNIPVQLTVNNGGGGTTTPIYTIQGASRTSPLANQVVTTTGVVIGIKSVNTPKGFFIQDPNGDGDPNTSDAIFVFTSSNPPSSVILSHTVQVKATVKEYASTSGDDQPFTELNSPTITDLGPSSAVITPVIITADPNRTGPNVRRVPSTTQVVVNNSVYDPSTNALDFYESMESMLVEVDNGLVTGPTNAYGETVVIPDNGAGATGLIPSPRGSIRLTPTDTNPERVMIGSDLDPVTRAQAPVINTNDKITKPVVGPLDFNFGNYKIDANDLIRNGDIDRSNEVQQETTTALTSATQLRFASFNIENFVENPYYGVGTPTAAQLLDSARVITTAKYIGVNLKAPDVMVIDEIQDNSGATDDGTVASDRQLNRLVAAIFTQTNGISYTYRYISPVNDQDGGEPGGNIRQVFLFRTDRGLSFVDKPASTPSTTPNNVNPDGSLLYSPGRIDPTNSAFSSSRKPLAGEFMFNGRRLIIIGNHLNSKGGDDSIYGTHQPPVLSSEVQRDQQATVIRNFVTQVQNADPSALVVVAGDMNDFQWSKPLQILENGADTATVTDTNKFLVDVIDDPRIAGENYSYIYEGNAQTLDHVLYSKPLGNFLSSVDVVHLNAEFSNADARRTTDHEPVTAVFDLPAVVTGTVDLAINKTHAGNFTAGQTGTYTITVSNAGTISTGAITVTDTLPAGLTYASSTTSGWSCSPSSQVVTCVSTALLGVNASQTLTLTVNIAPTATGTVTNTATVATAGDTNMANNTATDPTVINPVIGCNDFVVTLAADDGTNTCGNLTHAVNAANASSTPVTITFSPGITTVTVNGQLPAVGGPAAITIDGGGTCAPAQIGTPGIRLNNLGASVSLTVTGHVTVSGLAIGGFTGNGIVVTGDSNVVRCSWISTLDGTTADINLGNGIQVGTATTAATNTTLSRNLVSGNAKTGVNVVKATGTNLRYNWVGLAINGTSLLRNGQGALKTNGNSVIIGPGNRFRA